MYLDGFTVDFRHACAQLHADGRVFMGEGIPRVARQQVALSHAGIPYHHHYELNFKVSNDNNLTKDSHKTPPKDVLPLKLYWNSSLTFSVIMLLQFRRRQICCVKVKVDSLPAPVSSLVLWTGREIQGTEQNECVFRTGFPFEMKNRKKPRAFFRQKNELFWLGLLCGILSGKWSGLAGATRPHVELSWRLLPVGLWRFAKVNRSSCSSGVQGDATLCVTRTARTVRSSTLCCTRKTAYW